MAKATTLAARLGKGRKVDGRRRQMETWGVNFPKELQEINEALDAWKRGDYTDTDCESLAGFWRALKRDFDERGIRLPISGASSLQIYMDRREQEQS